MIHEDEIRTCQQIRWNAGTRVRCQNYVVFIGDVNPLDERCSGLRLDQCQVRQKSEEVASPTEFLGKEGQRRVFSREVPCQRSREPDCILISKQNSRRLIVEYDWQLAIVLSAEHAHF